MFSGKTCKCNLIRLITKNQFKFIICLTILKHPYEYYIPAIILISFIIFAANAFAFSGVVLSE